MKNVRIKAEEIEICGVRLALGKRYIHDEKWRWHVTDSGMTAIGGMQNE